MLEICIEVNYKRLVSIRIDLGEFEVNYMWLVSIRINLGELSIMLCRSELFMFSFESNQFG